MDFVRNVEYKVLDRLQSSQLVKTLASLILIYFHDIKVFVLFS